MKKLIKGNIGLDIDGVLCDWISGLINYAHSVGHTHFPLKENWLNWNGGLDKEEVTKVWSSIPDYIQFMLNLNPEPDCNFTFTPAAYVTYRKGVPLEITEQWLKKHKFPEAPVISVPYLESKLQALKELKIETFVEDRLETAEELNQNGILCYLINRPWNIGFETISPRIDSLSEL